MNVILETQKAVYAKLTGDATLMGMVKGVYDHVPDGAEYPYLTIGDFLANDNSTFDRAGYKLDLNVNVYSRAKGRKQVLEIMERVRELLLVKHIIAGFEHKMVRLKSLSTVAYRDGETLSGRASFKLIVWEEYAD